MTVSKKVSMIVYGVSALTLVSSFFVKDNTKAVNRRWLALGLFGAGWAIELAPKLLSKKSII